MDEQIADGDGSPESVPFFGPMKRRLCIRVVALSLVYPAVFLDAQPGELPRRAVLGAAVADKDGVEITSVTVGGAGTRRSTIGFGMARMMLRQNLRSRRDPLRRGGTPKSC